MFGLWKEEQKITNETERSFSSRKANKNPFYTLRSPTGLTTGWRQLLNIYKIDSQSSLRADKHSTLWENIQHKSNQKHCLQICKVLFQLLKSRAFPFPLSCLSSCLIWVLLGVASSLLIFDRALSQKSKCFVLCSLCFVVLLLHIRPRPPYTEKVSRVFCVVAENKDSFTKSVWSNTCALSETSIVIKFRFRLTFWWQFYFFKLFLLICWFASNFLFSISLQAFSYSNLIVFVTFDLFLATLLWFEKFYFWNYLSICPKKIKKLSTIKKRFVDLVLIGSFVPFSNAFLDWIFALVGKDPELGERQGRRIDLQFISSQSCGNS